MGAVRIYKAKHPESLYDYYVWQVRSDGCTEPSAKTCLYGKFHGGYCTAFMHFYVALKHLNDPSTRLGAYITK